MTTALNETSPDKAASSALTLLSLRRYHLAFWLLVLFFFSSDIATKRIAFDHQGINASDAPEKIIDDLRANRQKEGRTGSALGRPVFGDWFYLTPVKNIGAAWSSFSGRVTLLSILSIIVSGCLAAWQLTGALRKEPPVMLLIVSMLLGGALGNLWDRLLFGGVRDFLNLVKPYDYPIFNVADIWLTLGVIIYAAAYLRYYIREKKANAALAAKRSDAV